MPIVVPVDQFDARLKAGIERGLHDIAEAIYDYIKNNAWAYAPGEENNEAALAGTYYLDKKMPFFLGNLKESMIVEKIEDGYAVRFPMDYASDIEEGREITVAEARVMDPLFKDWEKSKGLHLHPATKIGKAHPFMAPAVEYAMGMAPGIMASAIKVSLQGNV